MKKRSISIILTIIIALCVLSGCGYLENLLTANEPETVESVEEIFVGDDGDESDTTEPETEPQTEPTAELTTEPETEPVTEAEPGLALVWKVEPRYTDVLNMWWAGRIVYDGLIMDLYTGEVSVWDGFDYPTGGIPAPIEWLYDEGNNLYGLYGTNEEYSSAEFKMFTESSFSEFLKEFYWGYDMIDRLRAFRKIDSSKAVQGDSYYDEWNEKYYYAYDLSGAYIDNKYAIAYGTKFLTDFIYEHDNSARTGSPTEDFIAAKLNGKWGVIDKTGKIAVPFLLDDIIFASGDSAFALYEGKYGILEIK